MKETGMNMERVRQKNRSLILRYINNKGPASRKEIARESGLTQASVTQITTALIEEGILKEVGTSGVKSSNPGRREIFLDIEAGRYLTYAVNMEPDKTTIAICDFLGNLILGPDKKPMLRQLPTDKEAKPEQFLDAICQVCTEMSSALKAKIRTRIENFSFAITGIVDRENGIARRAYGIWNEEVDVRGLINAKLGLPVLVENNVDAFATAVLFFGAGRKYDNLLVIKWGPGVGSSVVIDSHIYHGRHEKTAELGHTIVDPNGKPCVCGRRGCLETIVSADALSQLGTEEEKQAVIDVFARAIVNSGTILAPNRIVLYGALSDQDALREELIRGCAAYDPSFGEKRILHSSLIGKESYIGPVALYAQTKL